MAKWWQRKPVLISLRFQKKKQKRNWCIRTIYWYWWWKDEDESAQCACTQMSKNEMHMQKFQIDAKSALIYGIYSNAAFGHTILIIFFFICKYNNTCVCVICLTMLVSIQCMLHLANRCHCFKSVSSVYCAWLPLDLAPKKC